MILSRYLDHSTLACGIDNNDPETLAMMFEWADFIVIMHRDFLEKIPVQYSSKVRIFHVGDDIWGNPFHEDLQGKIVRLLNQRDVFSFGRVIDEGKVILKLQDYAQKILRRADPVL